MIIGDMEVKRKNAIEKVWDAIKAHNGQTILSTGITGDDARIAKAVVDAGVKLLEPNHPAVALAKGYKGITEMGAAELIRHEIKLDEMLEVVKGVRRVVGEDPYITVGVPGGFTETKPIVLNEQDFMDISLSGADSLHIHKSNLQDLENIVELAHKNGLLVDAYITHSSDDYFTGISADSAEEVEKVAKQMEGIGVDMIGLMTGMTYKGVEAGEISKVTKERLEALVSSVSVPTLAEGGINIDNYKAFKNTGVKILVIGTSMDQVVQKAAQNAVKEYLSL